MYRKCSFTIVTTNYNYKINNVILYARFWIKINDVCSLLSIDIVNFHNAATIRHCSHTHTHTLFITTRLDVCHSIGHIVRKHTRSNSLSQLTHLAGGCEGKYLE